MPATNCKARSWMASWTQRSGWCSWMSRASQPSPTCLLKTRGRGKILLVASLLAYQGVQNFAVYSAAKAYVLRLGEALHRELKRDGITVTALCPGMSDTGFATAAQQKMTFALKLLMMQPAPVVRAGIRALHAGRMSVVPGLANKAMVIFSWATPRWFHQAILFRAMNA